MRKPDPEPMVPVSQETLKQLADRPLLAVPPDLRAAVFQAWAVYRHLAGFDTPAPVAFAVSVWVNQHGQPPERVQAALTEITKPLHMRQVRYASDFTATLAELVEPDTPLRRIRRLQAELDARKEETA